MKTPLDRAFTVTSEPDSTATPHTTQSGRAHLRLQRRIKERVAQPLQHWYQKFFLELLLRQRPLPASRDGRRVPLNIRYQEPLLDERRGHHYVSNDIRSSRYTIWDFVPKQILFQCTRLSNFYFIAIGIPQTIPGISPTGTFTNILPVLFFILLTIAKEGYDDYRRHRLDKVENLSLALALRRQTAAHQIGTIDRVKALCKVLLKSKPKAALKKDPEEYDGFQWIQTQWSQLLVGDVIKLRRDDQVPADIILLHADSNGGTAYVETMALDGETNLKHKRPPPALGPCGTIQQLADCHATAVTEDPNKDLYEFNGRLLINEKTTPLTMNDVIYRGSVIRNTGTAIGLVINTGEECKIRMNANHHPTAKKPRMEKYANRIVIGLVIYVLFLTIGCSIGNLLWHNSTEKRSWYLSGATVSARDIIIGFAIEFNNIIPLALYISLEIVRLAQMWYLNNDAEMYDEASDTPMRCNTNTIIENLGQVSIVLSDKTGTLTDNVMKFRKLSVAGVSASHEKVQQTGGPSNTSTKTSDLVQLVRRNPSSALSTAIHKFLLGLALCHTCLPEERNGAIEFQGSSPDETALVKAAQELGYVVKSRTPQRITISINVAGSVEREETYEILDIIEFSSKRKRMSIVLRCPDGQVWLLCKGADSMILPRLKQASAAAQEVRELRKSHDAEHEMLRRSVQIESRTSIGARLSIGSPLRVGFGRNSGSLDIRPVPMRSISYGERRSSAHLTALTKDTKSFDGPEVVTASIRHIDAFATDGLRTLLFAHKIVAEEDYADWKQAFVEAETALSGRQEKIDLIAERLEQGLDFLGVSAIEDKLQQGVPDTIERLQRANMRIWMLTGDKRETALNIAQSARISRPESDVFIVDTKQGDLQTQLQNVSDDVENNCLHSVVVIDGHSLAEIDNDSILEAMFYSLITRVDSVICCRASPSQKAGIVDAIKIRLPQAVTLAIGDGANDISMIQSAHVGIGISGREGLQASRVADFSIAQFRYLERLLLIHGRYNYIRTARFILLTFWKETFFYMMQIIYQCHTGFTGTSLYENWSLTVFNTLFTSLCVIVMGIWEKDLNPETLIAIPELYVHGQSNLELNWATSLGWIICAGIEGIVVWFVCWAAYGSPDYWGDDGIFAFGDLVFTVAIVWTNSKLFLIETHHKTVIVFGSLTITVAGWFAWNAMLSTAYDDEVTPYAAKHAFVNHFGRDPTWWLTLVLVLALLVVIESAYKIAMKNLADFGLFQSKRWRFGKGVHPECDVKLWQEMEANPEIKARLKMLALGESNLESDSDEREA